MHEILRHLPRGARVLDLGARHGSFDPDHYPGIVAIRLDNECASSGGVLADAAHLPFRDGVFDAVVANHSLEHTDHLPDVLQELGRTMRRDGALYVAVPDASTFSDKLYRWIFHGGGHINPFRDKAAFADEITRATGMPLAATRDLHTSFAFLDKTKFEPRPPRRLLLVGYGTTFSLHALSYVTRLIDRMFGTRLSVYGWAFYFGSVKEEIETEPWINVCIRCGAGHSVAALQSNHKVTRRGLIFQWYTCSNCGTPNLLTQAP